MKKYIKYYSENAKRNIRFAANDSIAITTKLLTDKLEITFKDKDTGDVKLIVNLIAMDKRIESLAQNLLDAHMEHVVELAVRLMVVNDFKAFLADSHHTWPVQKMSQEWVGIFNLLMLLIHNDMGKDIKKLADDFNKLFSL